MFSTTQQRIAARRISGKPANHPAPTAAIVVLILFGVVAFASYFIAMRLISEFAETLKSIIGAFQ